jgi:hypothetical protein
MAGAIVASSRRTFAVLTVLGGEFGVRGRVGILPAGLSRNGISSVRVPILATRDRVQVENALAV